MVSVDRFCKIRSHNQKRRPVIPKILFLMKILQIENLMTVLHSCK